MEAYTRKRAGKRLLVAALGVATVSYVGTQSGCAAGSDAGEETGSEEVAPYDDEEPEIERSAQALEATVSIRAIDKVKIPGLVHPVGNLLPPPVGNLLAPPIKVIRDLEAAAVKQVK
jgi:hypothetical protein